MSNIIYATLRFSPKTNAIATHYLPARANEENTVFWYQWTKPDVIFPEGRLAMWNGKTYERDTDLSVVPYLIEIGSVN